MLHSIYKYVDHMRQMESKWPIHCYWGHRFDFKMWKNLYLQSLWNCNFSLIHTSCYNSFYRKLNSYHFDTKWVEKFNIYIKFQCLQKIPIPSENVADLSWYKNSFRLTVGASNAVHFVNIRILHKFATTQNYLCYSHSIQQDSSLITIWNYVDQNSVCVKHLHRNKNFYCFSPKICIFSVLHMKFPVL